MHLRKPSPATAIADLALLMALGVLALPATSGAAGPVSQYVLKHPKHQRCRAHYLRNVERVHPLKVQCVYQPPPFAGPWIAADEPPTIGNPGVTTKVAPTGSESTPTFFVTLSRAVWCPSGHFRPITVTISDPTGAAAITTERTETCQFPLWGFVRQSSHTDFSFSGAESNSGQSNLSVEFTLFTVAKVVPLFYEVSGPQGVIAQGAMLATEHHEHEQLTERRIRDLTQCEREHRDIYSGPEGLYCKNYVTIEGEGTFGYSKGSWPPA
jgi:hypothetical protein